ncbi:TPA: glycosyltransferase family 2 protein [Klebsiella pneumoniae]|nr:glycosyltransferase family 2 protein [Klebsiella pneumoniae]
MSFKEEKVTAIIVTYNPEIPILLKLVSKLSNQVFQVVIIDNSSNNKLEFTNALQNLSNVKLIMLDKNIGLATAQNIGVKSAFESTDMFLFFDQDSSIDDSFVCKQLKCYYDLTLSGKSVAAVGPTFIDRNSGYRYPATVYKGPFLKRIPVNDHAVESTFIIASGSLIPRVNLEKIGLMLDDFFIDFVDVEWCLRAKSYNLISYINPHVNMEHSIGDQRITILGRMISLHSDFRKYYIFRNGVFMLRLNYVPFGYKIRVMFFNMIRTVLGVVLSSDKIKSFKVSCSGWLDGFKPFNKKSR